MTASGERPADSGPGKGWDCEAYGPGLVTYLGDLCFMGVLEQECATRAECRARRSFDLQEGLRRLDARAASVQVLGYDDRPGNAADDGEDSADGVPVLYVTQEALFTWEQHRPGGCRCVCQLYHDGRGVCLEPAEPGHLLRVVAPASPVAPADVSELLQICAPCYAALNALTSTHTSTSPEADR